MKPPETRDHILAEFDDPSSIIHAAERLRELGYTLLDSYTPFPLPEVERALGIPRSKLNHLVFAAGLTGAIVAFLIIFWTNAVDYPLDVGGRPLDSVVTDIPIVFETTILFASVTAFLLALLLSGMPRLWDSAAEIEGVERTTIDRYWLLIDPTDPVFDPAVTGEMERLGAVAVRRTETVS